MKIGIATNITWFGAPVVDVARAAEALGFESLWMGEHIIIPVHIKNPVRYGVLLPPSYRHMPDPFIWLTAAAVSTTHLKLGLDICLVPQRNPLILAKEVACLDRISGGRLLLGVGSGWIEEEAEIMGVPFGSRWAKTMEHVRALKTIWTQETPSFNGEYVSFPPVYSYPKPLQQPHPPILIGAGNPNTNNLPTLKRVADLGDGWLPVYLSPAQMKQELDTLQELCEAEGRDFEKLDITLLVPAVNLGVGEAFASFKGLKADPKNAGELIAAYEEIGVQRLIVGLVDLTPESGMKVMEDAARGLKLT
ncbi:MAG: LLM class F420-dependent oxidoreductase [Steroidobacteraceae bacterium]|jgi:probable F420-dependent oxidoreductase